MTAPWAWRAILPVSKLSVRPPTSKLTFSNITSHPFCSGSPETLVQIRENTLEKACEGDNFEGGKERNGNLPELRFRPTMHCTLLRVRISPKTSGLCG